jgi:hypothetical protein
MQTTLGGDRLGSGKKNIYSDKTYERSTHDLSYVWRSSMSAGTLVPFMSEVGLPGDSWDIDLNCEVMTLPTIGPLFGSFKVQLDVFEVPIRLFNPKLHMNLLNIGMNMSQITLPQVRIGAERGISILKNETQIHPSCVFSYFDIRGLGRGLNGAGQSGDLWRDFNAIPWLGYWTIFKQYYSNKQEEYAYVIHNPMDVQTWADIKWAGVIDNTGNIIGDLVVGQVVVGTSDFTLTLNCDLPQALYGTNPQPNTNAYGIDTGSGFFLLEQLFGKIEVTNWYQKIDIKCSDVLVDVSNILNQLSNLKMSFIDGTVQNSKPSLVPFDITDIDNMNLNILSSITNPQYTVTNQTQFYPYKLALEKGEYGYSVTCNQEGLGVKTYQSDLLNNWISTEWIDGQNGVSAVTAVSTTGNKFTIDSLNLASKVYEMLNRIAISGGTYDDWLNAVYTHERAKGMESPVYHGSLIKELAFEEVVSTAETKIDNNVNPSGTLTGRGRLTNKHKGGSIRIKCNEPSYIMGIVSLTPRIDYSQGNKWDTNLKTLNDLHKPALDAIGYQNLITDQMAYFDTTLNKVNNAYVPQFLSAGKQPAWINYMTNINRCRGQFAIEEQAMFMTLNRRYEQGPQLGIKDVTTYIDPSKFNYIFAQTELTAENFWVQIANNITCRRKMSAKNIPNL